MAIPTTMAGATIDPVVHDVDERWTMAYAAALDDHLAAYVDTTRSDGVVAHPLFPVCVEWPAIVNSRRVSIDAGVPAHEMQRSVHAWHDTVLHRPIRPGDTLTTSLQIAGVELIKPGALVTTRLETIDADGDPVATTTQGGINLGVATEGQDRPDSAAPEPLDVSQHGQPIEISVAVGAGMAHTYTECARIWNPIHTDKAVAIAAGLPDIILHGTATMALGVSQIVTAAGDGDPTSVHRIVGRFGAMVLMPSLVVVRIWPPKRSARGQRVVAFEVVNEQGQLAVAQGGVVLHRASNPR